MISKKSIYKIHNNDEISFLSLEAAEYYIFEKYPEYITCKDQFIELCENLIDEYEIFECNNCSEYVPLDSNNEDMEGSCLFFSSPSGIHEKIYCVPCASKYWLI